MVCPLITATRTKKKKAADEAAAGCGGGLFDVGFQQLELGDLAFALAWRKASNGFT